MRIKGLKLPSYKHKEKTKKKIRLSLKGRKHNYHTKTEFRKGHLDLIPPEARKRAAKKLKGIKRSIKTRRKMSKAAKIRQERLWQKPEYREMMSKSHLIGEINNQLGRTRLEYLLWREAVLKRDDYVCQKCKTGVNLVIHHLFSWAEFRELRLAINNGLTLCKSCHKEIHKLKCQ